MSRRVRADVVVVGGGVVGATCALALAKLSLSVVLVEAKEADAWRPDTDDLRVYALAPDNVALLDEHDAWRDVLSTRATAYRRMRVWDASGGGELAFDADALGRRELGWIVEHALLVDRVWARLSGAGVQIEAPARVESIENTVQEKSTTGSTPTAVLLRLDNGDRVEARLAIAADGAESTLRALAGLSLQSHDYVQRGVVAYVQTEQPHEDTAWQRFLPTGPLAFLPCMDGRSSIVWTLPDAQASEVMALDDATFARILTNAFEGRLGAVTPLSRRAMFPLRRQLVDSYVSGRVLVLGDAAHVVHPLAGQGVNLGLRDVAGLRDSVADALRRHVDWTAPHRLARWARMRKSENAIAAHLFDGINRLFSSDGMHRTLLRGRLLGLAGTLPPLSSALWRRAAGI